MKHPFTRHSIALFLSLLLTFLPAFALTETGTSADSIPRSLSPYEQAVRDLKAGDYDAVRDYLRGLNRKDRGSFGSKMLQAGLLLSRLDYAGAREFLEGIPERSIKDRALFDRLSDLTLRSERMVQTSLGIELLGDPIEGETGELLDRLGTWATPVGIISEKSFTPASGNVQWRVIERDGKEQFGIVYRLGDGRWDEEHIEKVTVWGLDSLGRYSYPFLLSDGETLYFSYEGPETLGGRDIYLSRYDPVEHTLLVPQQLPVPVNSPADDYCYLYDEASGIGAFVTERNSPAGTGTLVKYRPKEDGEGAVFSVSDLFFASQERVGDEELFRPSAGRLRGRGEGEPLFWIKGRAIYGAEDLRRPASAAILRRYEALTERHAAEKRRLAKLREEFRPGKAAQSSLIAEIQSLERSMRLRLPQLRQLRNEVIKSETR